MTFSATISLRPNREGLRLPWLAVMAVAVIAWALWPGTPGERMTPKRSVAAAVPASPTNDVLVIPVTNKTGRVVETMVLVPLNGPPAPRATQTNGARPADAGAAATATNLFSGGFLELPSFEEKNLIAQVGLARRAISSGSFDGVPGPQTRAALRAFQRSAGLRTTGVPDDSTLAQLRSDAPLLTNYLVRDEDRARLLPLGATWLAKSEQERLDYETILELVAERTQSNPKLVRAMNAGVDWNRVPAGTLLTVVAIASPEPDRKAAFLRISIGERTLQAFDAETNLLAHFPCSIAARVEKRPVDEELHVNVLAPNPNYTFDPDVFPESAEARQLGHKLILQPGPNNPVGAVWIGLDKPGYGMHGTPKPEDVGRTESHGCFRLANWNAEHLLKLVTLGTPVFVDP